MEEISQVLLELYMDLTNSELIQFHFSFDKITVLIISDWFQYQTNEERLDYLAEGIQVACPELLEHFKFHFIALTPFEAERQRIAN